MPKARKSFDKRTKTKVSGLFMYQYPVRSRNGLFVWYLTFRESWGETTSKRYHTYINKNNYVHKQKCAAVTSLNETKKSKANSTKSYKNYFLQG